MHTVTQNQIPDNVPPFVYEDDLDELARLIFHNPGHPKAQGFQKRMDELEKEHLEQS